MGTTAQCLITRCFLSKILGFYITEVTSIKEAACQRNFMFTCYFPLSKCR